MSSCLRCFTSDLMRRRPFLVLYPTMASTISSSPSLANSSRTGRFTTGTSSSHLRQFSDDDPPVAHDGVVSESASVSSTSSSSGSSSAPPSRALTEQAHSPAISHRMHPKNSGCGIRRRRRCLRNRS